MRPFGCPVTILNTIDHLGSGPNWLFDIDALTKSMNYKPIVAGNQSNGNARTKACDDAGKARIETIPVKDYILLPMWPADLLFSQNSKDSPDARFKPSREEEKMDTKDPGNESEALGKDSEVPSTEEPRKDQRVNQELDAHINSTNNINTANNEEDVGAEADMNNLDAFILISPIPTTIIYKDHIVEQINRNLNSAPQTRRMTKKLKNILVVYQMDVKSAFLYGKIKEEVLFVNHQDLKIQTSLTESYHTPIITQPSTSKPQKKQKPRKPKRKDTKIPQSSGPTEPIEDEAANEENKSCMTDVVEKEVSTADPVTTAGEVVTTASVKVSAASATLVSAATTTTTTAITEVDLTLAQALAIEEFNNLRLWIKAKQNEKTLESFRTEKPLKKKDQIMYDQEVALNLQAQLQAELEEEERLARQKEEEANIALIESWDNTQAMMDADRLLAERLQAREQEELTDEEKARLFVELLEKRKKHFAALRAQEKRNKPPTKAQKKSTMSTYLKHMAGYKQSQLKNKSFAEIQKLFDKAMTRVNMFVDMDTELVRESSKKDEAEMAQESSSKRAGDELEQEKAKKQKIDDDQEEAKLKELMEVISDEEGVAIDAIPLSTKPPSIVDYKIIKEGKISIYQIIRADGSSKRYSAVIHMLKNFDREDLETLWKIVKARHGYTRPEEGYERVLWGDLKTMFEHHVEDLVWRYIQGNKVTVWKLFDSDGVHFVRFSNMHLFMLVEKRYPLTKATITEMLNKKLQADH
ncbi:hypothetical protein Tco_0909918 [Tanacetum coccineum]|uniref:Reverse transcriptase Ty1/copia-type domain-containing protein n=1 Tax=Tanacetum coccineum TaxID=301880 RepID=A0ABQ5CTP4_9ASTR